MEERPSEPNASVDSSAPPSVAQLAGRFREQEAASKEMPASKPTRRKPPCSLPLFPPRVELGQNGEEPGRPSPKESKQPRDNPKSPANASHPPKVKVKSSPLIEKLQANLAFAPAALLPGASPKSPGLKAMVSPFHSPPSTPSSPGVPPSRASESEEVPVSFDQPPEGSHLPCYNKVRTRGSIKRRPPSRRFRRSQSDSGELGGFRAPESSQENGAQEENEDEVFPSKSKASGSPPPSEGEVGREGRKTLGSHEKPPLRRTASRTEKREQQGQAPEDGGPQPTWAAREAPGTATEPAPASGTEAKNGRGSPTEESPAGERTEEAARVEEEKAGDGEEVPGQKSQDKKPLPEEGAEGQETPQACPGAAEAGPAPEEAKGKEKQDKGPILEPSCKPRTGQAPAETSSEVPETEEDDTSVQDTKM